jgi:hypothetical protein
MVWLCDDAPLSSQLWARAFHSQVSPVPHGLDVQASGATGLAALDRTAVSGWVAPTPEPGWQPVQVPPEQTHV